MTLWPLFLKMAIHQGVDEHLLNTPIILYGTISQVKPLVLR